MTYAAKIVADSRAFGVRLTSILATFPRFLLAEVNTHRDLSRNSASSRAIPVEKRLASIRKEPFVPSAFALNQRGMQAGAVVGEGTHVEAHATWIEAADKACYHADHLAEIGIHKQWANRLVEPYAWHTALLTATEWDNFFNLRMHKDAQPEFQIVAKMMKEVVDASTPRELAAGEWHLPFIDGADYRDAMHLDGRMGTAIKISVGRCAAVSFDRAEDTRTVEEWIKIHDTLYPKGHMSPFEHQAQVVAPVDFCVPGLGVDLAGKAHPPPFSPVYAKQPSDGQWITSHYACGNFRAPFLQYRKTLPGEAVWEPR